MNLTGIKLLDQSVEHWDKLLLGAIYNFSRGFDLEGEMLYTSYLANSVN